MSGKPVPALKGCRDDGDLEVAAAGSRPGMPVVFGTVVDD
jgi:hypothetical protein